MEKWRDEVYQLCVLHDQDHKLPETGFISISKNKIPGFFPIEADPIRIHMSSSRAFNLTILIVLRCWIATSGQDCAKNPLHPACRRAQGNDENQKQCDPFYLITGKSNECGLINRSVVQKNL
uniref:Uncharacterized protein n=1 Tax=Romanomermis culicivorax TaxID=13658 RepID=A0A915KKY8_ROMCU